MSTLDGLGDREFLRRKSRISRDEAERMVRRFVRARRARSALITLVILGATAMVLFPAVPGIDTVSSARRLAAGALAAGTLIGEPDAGDAGQELPALWPIEPGEDGGVDAGADLDADEPGAGHTLNESESLNTRRCTR